MVPAGLKIDCVQGKYSMATKRKKGDACPEPAGTLLIIGGHENKGEDGSDGKVKPSTFQRLDVLKTFKDCIHKKSPSVEVITTASGVPQEAFQEYKKIFEELGFSKVGHINHGTRKEVLDDSLEERVNQADAFFLTGGDQLKLTAIYGGTRFLTVLKERYIQHPVVVGGTSAGAMALSTPMIYAGNEDVQEIGGEIKITTGLEFLKDVCIDTHFVNRSRFVRMAQVVITNPTCIGIGLDEDTAIIVRNGSFAEVVGSGIVIVIDGFSITQTNVNEFDSKKAITARNLNVNLLSTGDQYEIPQVNPPHQ